VVAGVCFVMIADSPDILVVHSGPVGSRRGRTSM